jgi:murein DD-endopeptidase MepM/ murein hydrolase activator NlpD
MKRTLEEELRRIHEISYGKELINEQGALSKLWSKITGKSEKKIDDPTKADLVSDDVKEFFETLRNIKKDVSQQTKGNMNYQKDVESIQIALELLGYELPRYGIDGLFGPETASSVNRFKKDNNLQEGLINESTLTSPIGSTTVNSPYGPRNGRVHYGVDLKASSGTQIKSPLDGKVIDAKIKNDACGGTIYIDHGNGYKTRYCHCKQINVSKGDTVSKGDIIGLTGGAKGDVGKGRSDGAHLHFEVYKDGNVVDPMKHLGSDVGEYVASSGGSGKMTVVTPKMVELMVDKLEQKGVTSEELKSYLDKVVTTGGGKVITSDTDFNGVVTAVIDTLEGGYYHPMRHRSSGMGDSGETMMGIDRKHGGKINTSPEGVEFWGLIDRVDAKNKWEWNYKGGELEPKLKELVGKMIKPRYEDYSRRYLSPEAAQIVNESVPLKFHFIYAVWNGPGWFQKFAREVNGAVKQGVIDPKELAKFAINTRINSGNRIIAKTGNKIKTSLSTYLA